MSENTTASLKQEILEWANKPGTMEKFTTHDVYEYIHSAETPSHTSDALRSMWKYDKTLDREEFMDGNKKRFIYSLKKGSNVNHYEINYDKELVKLISQKENKIKGGAIPELSGMSKRPDFSAGTIASQGVHGVNKSDLIPENIKGYSISDSVINCDNNNQQIEIPNNFCIELRTPNGFTITIKAGDLIK